jgi:hypothetical protein
VSVTTVFPSLPAFPPYGLAVALRSYLSNKERSPIAREFGRALPRQQQTCRSTGFSDSPIAGFPSRHRCGSLRSTRMYLAAVRRESDRDYPVIRARA